MRRFRRAPQLIVPVALTLAACAAPLGASPEPSRPLVAAPDLETVAPSEAPVTGEVPAAIMDDLLADAAERADADPEPIEVVRAENVTWNDGSLGCPEPGMSYTMALVDGYHVIVAAADEQLDYRVTVEGGFKLCEDGGRPSR
jgi:hypothetical protein